MDWKLGKVKCCHRCMMKYIHKSSFCSSQKLMLLGSALHCSRNSKFLHSLSSNTSDLINVGISRVRWWATLPGFVHLRVRCWNKADLRAASRAQPKRALPAQVRPRNLTRVWLPVAMECEIPLHEAFARFGSAVTCFSSKYTFYYTHFFYHLPALDERVCVPQNVCVFLRSSWNDSDSDSLNKKQSWSRKNKFQFHAQVRWASGRDVPDPVNPDVATGFTFLALHCKVKSFSLVDKSGSGSLHSVLWSILGPEREPAN